MMIEAMVMLS
jgi:quercetin dioxygenase-like cupin family protein